MAREIVFFITGMGFGMWIIMFLDYAIDWYWQRHPKLGNKMTTVTSPPRKSK